MTGSRAAGAEGRRFDGGSESELAQMAGELELAVLHVPAETETPARELERRARELGIERLVVRARLITAEAQGRMGDNAALGRAAHQALSWAITRSDREVQCRCELLLSAFYGRLGDTSASLEHAVRAVELLPDTAPQPVRVRSFVALATALMLAGSFDAARDRFVSTLAMLDEHDEPDLRVAVLNNTAFLELLADNTDDALRAVRVLRAAAERYGIALDAVYLDTIARVHMSAGQYDQVEATLAPIVNSDAGSTEPHARAEALLTLAESQRRAGALESALDSVNSALRESRQRGIENFVVRGMKEHAAVLAAMGQHQRAYEQLLEFVEAYEAAHSVEREARARTLHAAFATEEAVRESRRYREMSLRDPLTGLYNRRYIDDRLPALLDRSRQELTHVSVAIVDLDYFKKVNDQASHEAGDKVLVRLAGLLRAAADRGDGFAARLGGEEFLLVLRGDPSAVNQICRDLIDTVRASDWTGIVGDLKITASMGVATTFAGGTGAADLLAAADKFLYLSKAGGRDRVTTATS